MSNLNKPKKPSKTPSAPKQSGKDQTGKPASKIELVRIITPKPPDPPQPVAAPEPPTTPAKRVAAAKEPPSVQGKTEIATPEPSISLRIPKRPCLHPISPPTEPMQYRAIGLVEGRYIPEEEEENKGSLLTADGTVVSTVVLGKMMAILKKRLDIAREYLWVVYPRTQPPEGELHLQITGVWAPLEMGKQDQPLDPGIEEGQFSIRGEIVSIDAESQKFLVKIKRMDPKALANQALRKFKLQIFGTLPLDAVGYFWDMTVVRKGNFLHLVEGTSIGLVPRKPFTRRKKAAPKAKPPTIQPEITIPPEKPLRSAPPARPKRKAK